ncbi:unnamed protein product, partial [Discosporangium mesarthrocarpum]
AGDGRGEVSVGRKRHPLQQGQEQEGSSLAEMGRSLAEISRPRLRNLVEDLLTTPPLGLLRFETLYTRTRSATFVQIDGVLVEVNQPWLEDVGGETGLGAGLDYRAAMATEGLVDHGSGGEHTRGGTKMLSEGTDEGQGDCKGVEVGREARRGACRWA